LNNVWTVETLGTLGDGQNAFCIMRWTLIFWGRGGECYGLNLTWPAQAHVLNVWSPNVVTILGSGRGFGR
jgi:hypothetical protein